MVAFSLLLLLFRHDAGHEADRYCMADDLVRVFVLLYLICEGSLCVLSTSRCTPADSTPRYPIAFLLLIFALYMSSLILSQHLVCTL